MRSMIGHNRMVRLECGLVKSEDYKTRNFPKVRMELEKSAVIRSTRAKIG